MKISAMEVAARMGSPAVAARTAAPQTTQRAGKPFADMLLDSLAQTPVKLSAHAQQRLAARQITLSDADMARLGQAMDQAAAKGARESLVLDGASAYVVNVPKRTVITAMGLEEAQSRVFTNIDSAVLAPPAVQQSATEATNKTHGPDPSRGGLTAAERLTRQQA